MALKIILMVVLSVSCASTEGEMTLANVTRLASGDLFSLLGETHFSTKLTFILFFFTATPFSLLLCGFILYPTYLPLD